jgi:signal peptidase II
MRQRRLVTLSFAGVVCGMDQLIKAWVLAMHQLGELPIEINRYAKIILAWNKGVSFSLLSSLGPVMQQVMIGIILLITGSALGMWWRAQTKLQSWAWAGVIGGAVGNIIDRFRFGAVVDFLYLHVDQWAWPAFNVADTAITISVLVILAESLYHNR